MPLHVAALKDNAVIGRVLLDHGARIEATSEPYEMQPLHVAASYGSPAIAALLLERGAEVDPKGVSGPDATGARGDLWADRGR